MLLYNAMKYVYGIYTFIGQAGRKLWSLSNPLPENRKRIYNSKEFVVTPGGRCF